LRPPSLRPQLNQIRLWARQGRTDAWIAHKLDISVEQLEQFKRDHRVGSDSGAPEPPPLTAGQLGEGGEEEGTDEVEFDLQAGGPVPEAGGPEEKAEEAVSGGATVGAEERDDEEERPRRRRRGRRGGRRRGGKPAGSFEGTFDHGEEGYGLWLDPAVADSPVYEEHWAGHRAVAVTVEPDAITIRREPAVRPEPDRGRAGSDSERWNG
jgi:hypothetical protein